MKIRALLLIVAVSTLIFGGCKKEFANHSVAPPVEADVYVAGFVGPATHAAYWKNGVLTVLDNNATFSLGRSIAVNQSGIYVAGDVVDPNSEAVYWFNGTKVVLSDPSVNADATGIAVNGSDIYVAGWQYDNTAGHSLAVLWKNGAANTLTSGNVANAVTVNGTDVYVAGSTTDNVAAYWKNGQMTTLPEGASANTIAVNGSDVYVGGLAGNGSALVWKNGVVTKLTDGAVNATISAVTGIAVNGGDTYLTGGEPIGDSGLVPTLWKNDVADDLTVPAGLSSNPSNNFATGVAVFNSDVYVAVQVNNNAAQQYESFYFKNDGTPVQLQDSGHGASAHGIAVVAKGN